MKMDAWAWGAPDTEDRVQKAGTPRRRRQIESTFQSVSNGQTTFQKGDAVIIDAACQTNQEWLKPPEYLVQKKKRGRAKVHEDTSTKKKWMHKDGLEPLDRVALIEKLYEDPTGVKMAKLRWFVRPGSIWGSEGPEEGHEVAENELYYALDSTYSHGTNAVSRGYKEPQCEDSREVKYLKRVVQIFSETKYTPGPDHFRVTRVFDCRPLENSEYFGEMDWDELADRGRQTGEWDVDPVWEEGAEIPTAGWANADHSEDEEDESEEDESESSEEEERPRRGPGRPRKQPRLEEDYVASDVESAVASDLDEPDDDSDGEIASDATQSSYEVRRGPGRPRKKTSGVNGTPRKVGRPRKNSAAPATPQKKGTPRKGATPRKPRTTIAPRAARGDRTALRNRLLAESDTFVPPLFTQTPAFARLGAHEQARLLLQVSAAPAILPRREGQRSEILGLLADCLAARTGRCIYIHGVPGTGKTATVHSAVRTLQTHAPDAFQYVEINGMKIAEPAHAFTLLWAAISGERLAPRAALRRLDAHFSERSPTRRPLVVLVDELDQMLTRRQDVLYNFFSWPHLPHSRLVVLAVANTMDLPERELSGRNRSRLGPARITFPPYTWQDLAAIIDARLGGRRVFAPMAVERIAKLVAGVSGDARKALDVARMTIERALAARAASQVSEAKGTNDAISANNVSEPSSVNGSDATNATTVTNTTSTTSVITSEAAGTSSNEVIGTTETSETSDTSTKTQNNIPDNIVIKTEDDGTLSGTRLNEVPPAADAEQLPLCSMQDVSATYRAMTSHGNLVFVRQLSLHQKIILLAVANCLKRSGLRQTELTPVFTWYSDFLRQTGIVPIPSHHQLFELIAQLQNLKLLNADSQRADYFQNVSSTVQDSDLFAILKEDDLLKGHIR